MRTTRRAYLYVKRKKGKSILLFLILLVTATFVLTGLSIQKASQEAQRLLRESFGGEFQIVVDFSENNPYFRKLSDGEGNTELYTELPITPDLIETVMSVNGIQYCDASTQTFVSTNLEIFRGNVALKGGLSNKVYARTVAGTEHNSFFQSGTMELTEGNHITGSENYVAVISRDLADQNNLKIGDPIFLQADQETNVKIIGIYEIRKPDSAFQSIVTYEKLENQIFIDLCTLQDLLGDMQAGFYDVTFTISDPAQFDRIISDVGNLSSIDWRAFQVTTNNQSYLDAAAPLQKLQALVSSIIFVIVLASASILTLVLTLWGRSRTHETGIFLSIGIGKAKIIGQYFTEVLLIAVFAFGCSYITSSAVANRLANGLLQQNTPASENLQNDGFVVNVKDGYSDDVVVSRKKDDAAPNTPDSSSRSDIFSGQDTSPETEISVAGTETTDTGQIRVTIGLYNMFQLYLIGVLLIFLSVGISSLSVMRLKPREILSKMS